MVVSGHRQSLQLTDLSKSLPLIYNSNQSSTTRGGCTQLTQTAHIKYPAWVIEEAVRWTLQDTYYIRPHYQGRESKQLYLIHRNKHREDAKMSRQRNVAQLKEPIKTPENDLNKMEISNLSDAEFKTLLIRMLKELSEDLSLIHISEPTRLSIPSRMPSSA